MTSNEEMKNAQGYPRGEISKSTYNPTTSFIILVGFGDGNKIERIG